MDRGSTEEAVVGVKSVADDDTVTCWRVKLPESDSDVGAIFIFNADPIKVLALYPVFPQRKLSAEKW